MPIVCVASRCCSRRQRQEAQNFTPEQISAGAEIYAVNCSPCHGARMLDPSRGFDLRNFPRDQRERFINSVTRGKNQMPPWGDFFKPDQLDALWAYVDGRRTVTRRRCLSSPRSLMSS